MANLLDLIADALPAYRYRISAEMGLQNGIAAVLTEHRIPFKREHVAGSDRYDFFCDGVVIEVKRDGSFAEVLRQVERYCKSPNVQAVVIASSKRWPNEPLMFHAKPVRVLHLSGRYL